MKNTKISLFLTFLTIFLLAKPVLAENVVAEQSAQIKKINKEEYFDYRVVILRKYLESHNSPLSESSEHFVYWADKYELDWRMVPAISGVESTFGKNIPANSYNAYGWANGNYSFESWEDSIEVVSKTLREKYYNRGATTINQIARRYAPPSSTWAWKVTYFMEKIDPIPVDFDL
jgi:hypothetical protein